MQDNSLSEQSAIKATESWLSLIDHNDTEESWNQAASLFRQAVSVEQWKAALTAAQNPIGKAVSRKLKDIRYTTELPGAPDGEYFVLEYETAFEKKKKGAETVVPMKDEDGEWRVSGYFVK